MMSDGVRHLDSMCGFKPDCTFKPTGHNASTASPIFFFKYIQIKALPVLSCHLKKRLSLKGRRAATQTPSKRVKTEATTLKPNEQINSSVPKSPTKLVMHLHGIMPILPDTVYANPHITSLFANIQVLQPPLSRLMIGNHKLRFGGGSKGQYVEKY
jgi:hypothetical protein